MQFKLFVPRILLKLKTFNIFNDYYLTIKKVQFDFENV